MADSYGPGDQGFQRRNGNGETGITNAAPYQGYGGYQSSSDRSNLNYPPPHNQSNPSFFKSTTNLNMHKNEDAVLDLYTSRTPSPSPSEHAMLNRKGFIDWKKLMNWRFWFRREWLCECQAVIAVASRRLRLDAYSCCNRVLCYSRNPSCYRHPHQRI